ncbi:hypothetical protein FFK22_037095 [Mycobacterium sp. KBS0706]|uniref:hypothetical protein n=1 Tax=Mycobacterium sp. KBS0706 TaxID=2578109 RepID=UPI00110FD646|nr:hypothetical protein [Mycobacterium sp. KBS0706]TSD83569.1 hypothetical protein FFK22_037095 [Mycobacterium sp. KBS0706]
MAKGHEASEWDVKHGGYEGVIRSGVYRARFKVRAGGRVDIIWQEGPGPGDAGPVERGARAAIETALRGRGGP